MSKHSAHSEWVLSLVVALDKHHRGFAGDFLRASNERRQVIAAYLATMPPSPDCMLSVGKFLARADHSTILATAYGSVPRGFRRTLGRIKHSVQDQRCYTLLFQLLDNSTSSELVNCIRYITSINRTKLLIARILPPSLCRPNVVEALRDVEAANDVSAAYELLISRGADPDALAQAICRVNSERALMNIWPRWLAKAECPYPHPVATTETYKPISTGEALCRASRLFKNCASQRYLLPFIEGTDAFAEFSHQGTCAMVHLRREELCWKLEGLFGPKNTRPSSSLRASVCGHLHANGVKVVSSRRQKTPWEPMRRLIEPHFLDFEFEL